MIFIIDNDTVMAKCIAKAAGEETRIFTDGITAMGEIDKFRPGLIFLDILLEGPDGFTFLNELLSYKDTAQIPVVLVTSLDLKGRDFGMYGVVGVLDKETMRPEEIRGYVEKYYVKSPEASAEEITASHEVGAEENTAEAGVKNG